MIKTSDQEPIRYRNYRFYLNSLTSKELFTHQRNLTKACRKIKKQKKIITVIYDSLVIAMTVFAPFSDSQFGINSNYMIALSFITILGGAGIVSWLDFKLDRVEEKIMLLKVATFENE